VSLLGGEPAWGALTGVRPVKLPVRAMREGATPARAEQLLKERYRVSPLRRRLAMDCARASLKMEASLRPEEVSLYVGIPFCPSRCAYCSFISAAAPRALGLVEPYLEALSREIGAAGEMVKNAGLSVRSVYVGGGTPTTLSAPQLSALLLCLRHSFDLSRCTEFTVEAGRPDTITREKLEVIEANGAGRVSVNPQTMSDEVLRAMGRAHTTAETLAAYALVRAHSSLTVNMDLIAGLPRDTQEGFRNSLDTVLSLAPENITVHTLALKKGSRLMEEKGALPGGETVAAMLGYAHACLRERGYIPYYLYRQKFMSGSFENVGWCLPGFESAYNICMMEELHTVLALGAGGVTKLVDGARGRIVRVANPKYPQEYIRDMEKNLAAKQRILTL
jgi:oxygen-independent coproporphyrinogen-3 oxidase